MANYKEIVTKAVIAKGKRLFSSDNTIVVDHNPSTILGCWVINHNFNGSRVGEKIEINGSYDVNIWYSYNNDSSTDVVKRTDTYHEVVHLRNDSDDGEIIVKSLKQPSCVKVDIKDNTINYTIEKELGIELVGDTKIKIEASNDEDPWEEIEEDKNDEIDTSVEEDFIKDNNTQ